MAITNVCGQLRISEATRNLPRQVDSALPETSGADAVVTGDVRLKTRVARQRRQPCCDRHRRGAHCHIDCEVAAGGSRTGAGLARHRLLIELETEAGFEVIAEGQHPLAANDDVVELPELERLEAAVCSENVLTRTAVLGRDGIVTDTDTDDLLCTSHRWHRRDSSDNGHGPPVQPRSAKQDQSGCLSFLIRLTEFLSVHSRLSELATGCGSGEPGCSSPTQAALRNL